MPIHAAPTSAVPIAGAPGCQAFGASFKAAFHDGFVFDPVLGSDYPANLPWRWTTESVTAGEVVLLAAGAPPEHAHTDWRYEYRWPDLTEAYEVRAEGVEQSFVFARAPRPAGDLVVRGRIDCRPGSARRPPGTPEELAAIDSRCCPGTSLLPQHAGEHRESLWRAGDAAAERRPGRAIPLGHVGGRNATDRGEDPTEDQP